MTVLGANNVGPSTLTWTPGIMAFDGSVTTPAIRPVISCEKQHTPPIETASRIRRRRLTHGCIELLLPSGCRRRLQPARAPRPMFRGENAASRHAPAKAGAYIRRLHLGPQRKRVSMFKSLQRLYDIRPKGEFEGGHQ